MDASRVCGRSTGKALMGMAVATIRTIYGKQCIQLMVVLNHFQPDPRCNDQDAAVDACCLLFHKHKWSEYFRLIVILLANGSTGLVVV